jgi:hypothetical protein
MDTKAPEVLPEEVTVCGTKYRKAEDVPTGTRAVVVVDRGWIFAGNVTRKDGRILLTDALLVFKWEALGFHGMLANPTDSRVRLEKMPYPVDIPEDSEIFIVPVPDTWGRR